MMTRIQQIGMVRQYYERAVCNRIAPGRYVVRTGRNGDVLGEGRTKRVAWDKALTRCRIEARQEAGI